MGEIEVIASNLNSKKENTNVKKRKKRASVYARVSTDSEEQLTSYSSQIKHYTKMIKSNPDWIFVGVYADEGISGTQVKNRTEFQRMLHDAFNGEIDIIIAKSISRFARNTLDTLKIIRKLREHNVDVYFEKENIHTLELDSEMFLTLYSAFAQAESESISQNVKIGLKAKMKRGEFLGYVGCYGYDWDKENKVLTINKKEAEVVRMIFDLYSNGAGCRTIAQKLNELKIITHKGKKQWNESSIRYIIGNEKYVGDLMEQKTYIESPLTHKHVRNFGEKERYYVREHHEPIITREVWDKAQEILNKRRSKIIPNGSKHTSSYSNKYAFSGKIICGFCGTTYVRHPGSKKKSGKKNNYWQCYQRLRAKKDCNDSIYIREEALERAFIEIYNTITKDRNSNKEKLLKCIKETLEENNYEKEIDKLNKEEEKTQNKMSKLVDMRLEDSIDKDTYLLKEKELKNELKSIIANRKELLELSNKNKYVINRIKKIENVLNNLQTLNEFSRDAFEELVERIIVGEIDDNGNKNPNIIRFILKTGKEISTELVKKVQNDISDNSVLFTPNKQWSKYNKCLSNGRFKRKTYSRYRRRYNKRIL